MADEAIAETSSGGNGYVSVSVGETASGVPTITILETGPYFEGAEIVEVDGVAIDISEVFATPVSFSNGNGIQASSISGCTALPDSAGWKRRVNCRLYSNGGVASATMVFDYSVKSGGGRIDGTPYAHDQQCVLGSDRNVRVFVPRRINSGSVPAQARHQFDCYWGGGTYSRQAWHAAYAYGSVWGEHN